MSANKTPQIHTQGNSKYLPKHVCFAGTVSERESTSKLRARAAQTLCALRSSSPGSSAPSPSARFSHPSRRLHTPSPSARRAEHGGTAPRLRHHGHPCPAVTACTATILPTVVLLPLVTTTRSPRLPFRHRHQYQCHHYYHHRYHFHHRHRKSKELPDHCSSRPPLRLSLEPGAPCESQAGGSFSLFQSIQGNHSDPYNSLLSRVYSPLY